jgi:hypothetical protein
MLDTFVRGRVVAAGTYLERKRSRLETHAGNMVGVEASDSLVYSNQAPNRTLMSLTRR